MSVMNFSRISGSHCGLVQRLLDAGVHDAHAGSGVLHVVVDQLGVVLRADAGQVAAARPRGCPGGRRCSSRRRAGCPSRDFWSVLGLTYGDDVVHVKAGDGRGPSRASGMLQVGFERLEAVAGASTSGSSFLAEISRTMSGVQARVELCSVLSPSLKSRRGCGRCPLPRCAALAMACLLSVGGGFARRSQPLLELLEAAARR